MLDTLKKNLDNETSIKYTVVLQYFIAAAYLVLFVLVGNSEFGHGLSGLLISWVFFIPLSLHLIAASALKNKKPWSVKMTVGLSISLCIFGPIGIIIGALSVSLALRANHTASPRNLTEGTINNRNNRGHP